MTLTLTLKLKLRRAGHTIGNHVFGRSPPIGIRRGASPAAEMRRRAIARAAYREKFGVDPVHIGHAARRSVM